MVFFESSRYIGTEGETKRICLNITNPIAGPADVSISARPAQGYMPFSGTHSHRLTNSLIHSLTHSLAICLMALLTQSLAMFR